MNASLIITNITKHPIEEKLPELVYTIESNDIDLKQVNIKDTVPLKEIIQSSDFVLYLVTVDCEKTREHLTAFFDNYTGEHPPFFVVIDSMDLLGVDFVNDFIHELEAFAKKCDTEIIDIKYFKDSLRHFRNV